MRWEYLASGLVALAAVAALDRALGTRLLGRRRFWLYLGVLFVCQVAFEGYLTGRPVTRYAPCCVLGPRLLRTPVEDYPFGLALVGLVAVLWEWCGRRRG